MPSYDALDGCAPTTWRQGITLAHFSIFQSQSGWYLPTQISFAWQDWFWHAPCPARPKSRVKQSISFQKHHVMITHSVASSPSTTRASPSRVSCSTLSGRLGECAVWLYCTEISLSYREMISFFKSSKLFQDMSSNILRIYPWVFSYPVQFLQGTSVHFGTDSEKDCVL